MNNKPVVSNVEVFGLGTSIKAAKYPMSVDIDSLNDDLTSRVKSLAQSPSGAAHDQWLTGVTVQFDLNCTLKMWIEAERYRFLYFISSQSTMHRITKFDLDTAYNKYVDDRIIDIMKDKVNHYNYLCSEYGSDSERAKEMYLDILYNNPSGFRLTARMTTNYRQLKTIYKQRKNHRLPDWREFCSWIETLPNSELIIGEK